MLSSIHFGIFDLDLRARELRKGGVAIALPEQSIKILALLLEKPGELVLREEIRRKLWPNDTVVEFDHSINAAVKRLRQALGDPAENPQYIETLARRGYRWKYPIERTEVGAEVPPPTGDAAPSHAIAGGNLIGKKVSHYRILEVLGGGGMGVVFKAEDLKLGRRVALKFLPEETATDPLTLRRFEQEARAASSLNHANICTIYQVEEYEGQPFIVMELLEGETLREMISSAASLAQPFPLTQLLDLATQIVQGLEAAHQKGIIHRDIKPANLFLTNRGQLKILDFGLAKLAPALAAKAELEKSDREMVAGGVLLDSAIAAGPQLLLSRTGETIGTAGYMSPEQLRGEKIDDRTDLFSFGLVLYEMATMRPAFNGDTAAQLHQAILNQTPAPVRKFNPELPSGLEVIVKKALEKDREARYQSASEIHSDLENVRQALAARPQRIGRRGVTAGIFALLVVVIALVWFARKSPPPQAVVDLKLRQLTTSSAEDRVTGGAISPDGKYLAYADLKGIYLKLLLTGEVRTFPKPAEFKTQEIGWESGPWFPDSTGFLANAHPIAQGTDDWSSEGASIWRFSTMGEAPIKLRDHGIAYAVSPDNTLISFGQNKGKAGEREIWLMGPRGEQARKFYEADADGAVFGLSWSPDGRRVLYIQTKKDVDSVLSRDFAGGNQITLVPPDELKNIREFTWLPDGRMLYAADEAGTIGSTCNYWVARIDVRNGAVIEKPKRLTNWTGFCMTGMSSTADGKRLAFLGWESHSSSYVGTLASGGRQLLELKHFPPSRSSDGAPDWTNDSKAIILVSNRSGDYQVFRQPLDDDSALRLTDDYGGDPRATPDGKWVLYFAKTKKPQQTAARPVMRVPIGGGPSQLVFTESAGAYGQIVCARPPTDLCAIAERSDDHRQLIVSVLDALKGRGPELTRFTLDPNDDRWWVDLSPDGSRMAAIVAPPRPISIVSLRGQLAREVKVKGWSDLMTTSWTADGKSLFVISGLQRGRALLHVDLQGNAEPLWQDPATTGETVVSPSPDGRQLSLSTWTMNSNMWTIENF